MEKAGSREKLYTRMRLWEFANEYVIEPTDGKNDSFLVVSRVDGSMKLVDELPQCNSVRVPKLLSIYGVIGVLKLMAGSYLFVITDHQNIGSHLGHPVFKVSSMKILPCDLSLKTSPTEQKKIETECAAILNVAEKTHGLFFSYDANLTLSMQKLHELGDESKTLPLWKQTEPRFVWNNHLMEDLIDSKLDAYLLPIVQGSFQHFQAAIGKDIIDITLIARRCTIRTGTRLWRRGADSDGYVANFVETEQIMQLNGYTASFLQIRGSMPFLWEQIVDLTYKPKFDIVKRDEAPLIAERHFLGLKKRYGSVIAIDLVNKHGGEGRLNEVYSNAMKQISNEDIRYIHFDFHRICGHIHFERLSILYDQISDFLNKNRYLLLNEKGEKIEEQCGIVRTNCVDCLDRTNVTQSMIGRKILESQLRRIGAFGPEETISFHPNFDENFKVLWANHGDDISTQYTGTPALKGDFVRYGQRTMEGIFNDGWNAMARYYLNNFRDGTRQDAIDLVHGNFMFFASRDMAPPPRKGLEAVASLRIALSVVSIGFLLAMMSLLKAPYSFWHLLLTIIWTSISMAVAVFVRANGRAFCNRPRLNRPR